MAPAGHEQGGKEEGKIWLEAAGAGGSPALQAKQPPAGLHGGRREEGGKRGSRGMHIEQRLGGWQDWFLTRSRGKEEKKKGGRSMKVGARLVSRPRFRPRTAAHLPAANRR